MSSHIIIGKKHKVVRNVPTPDGMLYEGEVVKVTDMETTRVRVTDDLGKIYWIEPKHLQVIT
tara:strand:+ start:1699 stop:1884 length:186 start_codon:yes stop_codon:yes gene_type:complete